MRVAVIGGSGYVGLITSLGLAELGHHVIGVDIDHAKVEMLQAGRLPFFEAGAESVLQRTLEAGHLRFTTDLAASVRRSEVVFITVATPASENGDADVSQVESVASELRRHFHGYTVVVVKSTVPVGTVERVARIIGEAKREGAEFDVVANPEFLREGEGLFNFLWPDRIVIGARSERARRTMRALYQPIITRRVPWPPRMADASADPVAVVETDLASAQMIKYASNAFLATRIAFIDEIAWLCEEAGADVKDVALGMGYDPRIGHSYLQAGLGFGGPCLEKDLRALVNHRERNGEPGKLLSVVLEHNEDQIARVLARVKELAGSLQGTTIAVFGLAFKAGTDDLRNSLALRVIEHLERERAVVRAYDPAAVATARALRPTLACSDNPYDAVRGAAALLILTDWPQFRVLDYRRIRGLMARPCIVDPRNLLDAPTLERLGFTYGGIGMKPDVTSRKPVHGRPNRRAAQGS